MDNYLSFTEYLDGYVVTGFTGDQNVTTVTIPATHLNKTVYGVRGNSTSEGTYLSIFGSEYDGNITSITVENGVTFIGIGAFANCDHLSSVVLPNSIQYIDNGAFYNCVTLPSVNIPSSVTTIGDFAFGNCSGLVSVTLPTTPITISRFAFTGCTGLSNYSAMALSRYGISPSVATPKLVATDALSVFLSKLKDLFVVINGDEYNLSLADSVTFDQNSGMTFNGLKLRDVNDVTKVSDVNLVLPIVAGDNVSVTQSNGKILISATAVPITIDDALSTTSENPVQNKVVNTALGTKADLTNASQVVTLGGLKDGNNANYKLNLPDTTNWTEDKTIATTDQITSGGGGGTTLYQHDLQLINSSTLGTRVYTTIICNRADPIDDFSTLKTYLANKYYHPATGVVSIISGVQSTNYPACYVYTSGDSLMLGYMMASNYNYPVQSTYLNSNNVNISITDTVTQIS